MLVGRAVPGDPRATVALGEQGLSVRGGVVRDDGVGGVEDRLGGAEVLLQQHDGRVGEVRLELQDVAHVGRAESVDRLVRVPDHRDVAVLGREEPDQLVLGKVGVLVLVDEHVAEPVPVVLEHVGAGAQHDDGVREQVVEVHGVRRAQAPLVLLVEPGDPCPVRVLGAEPVGGVDVGPWQLGLRRRDRGGDRAGREPAQVEPLLAHEHLDDVARVGVVVDREARLVAEPVRVRPQEPKARGVEREHPHPLGAAADELDDARAHLVRRLVRERDREDREWRRVARREQVRDPAGEHPRLARTRARHDEERAAPVLHGLALRAGQVGDEPVQPREVRAVVRRGGRRRGGPGHSHSIVPGGLDVTSSTTRFTPSTSAIRRFEMRSTTA